MIADLQPVEGPAARRKRPRVTWWLTMFLVAFALRSLYVFAAYGPDPKPFSDPADYDAIAWNLATGAGFSHNGADGPFATAFRPPLVPWLTGLLYLVTGHSYLAALLLQCAIGALLPLMLTALGGATFGQGVGRLAGWLAVVHPMLVFFSGYLLTDTTFCLALLAALHLSLRWMNAPRPALAFGAGILWGLTNLARPNALPLALIVALWGWVPLGLALRPRARLRQMAILLAGMAVVIAPWTVRNAFVLHAFVPVSSNGGHALFASNNAVVWNDPAQRGGGGVNIQRHESYASLIRGRSEVEADRVLGREALAFLRQHAREWPAMAAAKLARLWRLRAEAAGTGSWNERGSLLARLKRTLDPLPIWSLIIWPFAVWGLARACSGPRRWFRALSLLTIVYFTLLAVVYWGALRMRLPVEPLLTLLAAAGIVDVRQRLRARTAR
jgi:4-amino-4-deoxy-L-arabinose transferase-like glycosyltransferase